MNIIGQALVRLFKTALERMPHDNYKVVIRADKRPAETHERKFNAPTIDKVAILIVGENLNIRDIVLTRRDTGQLQQVCETHRSYDTLQYPLMFWQEDDGYDFNIKMINPLNGEETTKKISSCNPKWKEIVQMLLSGQTSSDRHDITARVFKHKIRSLMNLKFNITFIDCYAVRSSRGHLVYS
ncbi:uncharacterized protein LOC119683647 isoform X1 [Teleopsis dalmanni]|uniref:uncharacterized protein LOC119683647 isoform X1 n=1 Tax=Teleopsis dalmanni TaxID=139649 RepID=UPI0018CD08C9|nr:uncharacterized protein LOC119683647 isoform X1 [Teleopsis dalmanni]